MSGPLDDPVRRDDDGTPHMIVLERDVVAAGTARAWLKQVLDGRVNQGQLDDACLVISELVTNALRHGLGEVVVRSAVSPAGDVQVSVSDSSDDRPRLLPVDPTRVGGVGLRVVDELSTAWGVSQFPGGKTVWATFAPARPAAGPVSTW